MKLTKEAREKRAVYLREWRKKNPEKQREYNARYWNKKANLTDETTPPTQSDNMDKQEENI